MPSGRKEGVCVCSQVSLLYRLRGNGQFDFGGQLALQSILQLTATNELHNDGQREYQV